LIGINSFNQVAIDQDANGTFIGGPLRVSYEGSASISNGIIMPNKWPLLGGNSGGTNTVPIAKIDDNDQVNIDQSAAGTIIGGQLRLNTGQTALGGGATATLGTVGPTGPAGAAQIGWQKLVLADGQTYWVPVWQ
jgi:hypothetical protein